MNISVQPNLQPKVLPPILNPNQQMPKLRKIPKHVGIIPDGNRRWATQQGLGKHQGYQKGLNPGVAAVRLAAAYGIEEISFYGFTTDNCKRPANQFQAFQTACVAAAMLMAKEPVSLLIVGNQNSDSFPQELLPYTNRTDFNGGGIKVNILVNYGWEWDLGSVDCHTKNRKKIMESLESKAVSRMDLIIRWGGMRRLSGFLPVQSVYADFFVVNKMWPDFAPQDFQNALEWYSHQDDTLGG